jgi:hypothetical protein
MSATGPFDNDGVEADREATNDSDGQHFWGYDQENGTTDWYTDNGILDSNTPTP